MNQPADHLDFRCLTCGMPMDGPSRRDDGLCRLCEDRLWRIGLADFINLWGGWVWKQMHHHPAAAPVGEDGRATDSDRGARPRRARPHRTKSRRRR